MGKLFTLLVEEDDLGTVEKIMALITLTELAICTDTSSAPLRYKALYINATYRQMFWQGKFTELAPMELDVLHLLARRPGWVPSQGEIHEFAVPDSFDSSWTGASSIVYKLRHKLNTDFIQTVYGKGYKLLPPWRHHQST